MLPAIRGVDDEPNTPWDGDMKELESKQMDSSLKIPVSTTAEQNEFISQVCASAARGDLSVLTKLLDAAKLSEALSPSLSVMSDIKSAASSVSLSLSEDSTSSKEMAPPIGTNLSSSRASADGKSIVAEMLNRVNDNGESTLMIASYGGGGYRDGGTGRSSSHVSQQRVLDICKLLIDHGASVALLNNRVQSCLHIVAQQGFEQVANYFLLKGCPVNSVDSVGDSAAHIAARNAHLGLLKVLIDCGANLHIRNNQAKCPLDVVVDHPDKSLSREDIRRSILTMEPRLRSLILYHEDCLEHAARRESDWEGPDRLRGIMNLLMDTTSFPSYQVEISNQFEKAHVELLSRVHAPEYIAFVNTLSKKVQEAGKTSEQSTVPFTPQVQKIMMKQDLSETKSPEYCDTSFSSGTLKAARRAAGAVAHAVDRVLLGRNRNAFCVVRPPGHHAGYRGLLDGGKSCGFCIFNSVAAGALHALEAHSCERVAIIDIDVHHGTSLPPSLPHYLSLPKPRSLLSLSPFSHLPPSFSIFVSPSFFLHICLSLLLSPNFSLPQSSIPSFSPPSQPGNGTEDIVRRYQHPSRLFFFSVHLFDKDEGPYEFFPGTGKEDDTVRFSQSFSDHSYLISTHPSLFCVTNPPLFRPTILSMCLSRPYGRSQLQRHTAHDLPNLVVVIMYVDAPTLFLSAQASDVYFPPQVTRVGRDAFRQAILQRLVPALRAFSPDLILLSTGATLAPYIIH
jgi:acetoin utilization deacetylase AcuC-like enzyme